MTGVKSTIVGGECPIFVFTSNSKAILKGDERGCRGAMDESGLVFGRIRSSITNNKHSSHAFSLTHGLPLIQLGKISLSRRNSA